MLDKRDLGFTLVEIMIVVVIFTLLIGTIFTVLATGKTSFQIGNVRIELQQDLRRGMDWITEELRQSGSSTISGVPANGSWYDTITFRIPVGVSGGNIVWETDEIQYLLGGLNNRQLLRKVDSDEKVLANNIISLEFSRQSLSSGIVEIALEAEKETVKGHLVEVDLDFKIKLRN